MRCDRNCQRSKEITQTMKLPDGGELRVALDGCELRRWTAG
ncbi:unnamed protein product [Rhodiola kirilowii]